MKFLDNTLINTLTTEYCSDLGTGVPPQYRYTKKEIKEWLKDKNVNPKTGRKISNTGKIYKDFEKACKLIC